MSLARVKELNATLLNARYAYYVLSAPVMEDASYDALERELKALVTENPTWAKIGTVLQTVGSDLAGTMGDVKHSESMLSLDNAYAWEDMERFLEPIPDEATFTIECKVDGLSLSNRYAGGKLFVSVTRGNGSEGDDVTLAAMTISDVPKVLPAFLPPNLEIRGEVFVTASVFDALNDELIKQGKEPYKNQRNLASGSLKLKDYREVVKRHLSFLPWQILGLEPPEGKTTADMGNPFLSIGEKLESPGHLGLEHAQALEFVATLCGMRQPQLWRVYSKQDLREAIEKHRILRDTLWTAGLGMPTDGIVIKVEELIYRKQLGYGTKSPKWAIAYKYPAERAVTKLLGVRWQVGRTGKLTPVGDLEPVLVSGSTVSKVNLNNITYIREDLGNPKINDTVTIYKGGEVIPQVQEVAVRSINGIQIEAPSICPDCGMVIQSSKAPDTVKDGVTEIGVTSYTCNNPGCPGRMIAHFIYIGKREVMDIEGLGDVIAERFVREDIAPSLGYLWQWGAEAKESMANDQNGFEAAIADVGFSVAQVRNLVEALDKAKTAPWDKWLQGLGIPGIAKELAKALANTLALDSEDLPFLQDKLATLTPDSMEGLGPEKIKGIQLWAGSPIVTMDLNLLYNAGVRPTGTVVTGSGDRPLEGYVLCITGEFGEDRVAVQQKLESLGAVCKSGVSKKVNLLLIGTSPGQSKRLKATELGIRTEGLDWLVTALKSGGLALADNGMPDDEAMESL